MRIPPSSKNPYVKKLTEILERFRDYPEVCIVEGMRSSELFVSSSVYELERWFLTHKMYESMPMFIDKEYVTVISDDVMKKLSRATTPSGILGFFIEKPSNINEYNYPTFVLHTISDPGNVGTIIRTAVALGRKKIIMLGGCYHHSYKVVQASSGMLAHIRVMRTTFDLFLENRDKKIPLYALAASGEPFSDIPKNELECSYLLVGNEAHGLDEMALKRADRIVSLPMNTICESLNAAVAASVVGYRAWSK